jgi:hypothetical protein
VKISQLIQNIEWGQPVLRSRSNRLICFVKESGIITEGTRQEYKEEKEKKEWK